MVLIKGVNNQEIGDYIYLAKDEYIAIKFIGFMALGLAF